MLLAVRGGMTWSLNFRWDGLPKNTLGRDQRQILPSNVMDANFLEYGSDTLNNSDQDTYSEHRYRILSKRICTAYYKMSQLL